MRALNRWKALQIGPPLFSSPFGHAAPNAPWPAVAMSKKEDALKGENKALRLQLNHLSDELVKANQEIMRLSSALVCVWDHVHEVPQAFPTHPPLA